MIESDWTCKYFRKATESEQEESDKFMSDLDKKSKPNDKLITFGEKTIMALASVLSDCQEEISNKHVRGKINLVKGVLFSTKEIVHDGFTFHFKSKNANNRFCDKCGLLKVGEYKECDC